MAEQKSNKCDKCDNYAVWVVRGKTQRLCDICYHKLEHGE